MAVIVLCVVKAEVEGGDHSLTVQAQLGVRGGLPQGNDIKVKARGMSRDYSPIACLPSLLEFTLKLG